MSTTTPTVPRMTAHTPTDRPVFRVDPDRWVSTWTGIGDPCGGYCPADAQIAPRPGRQRVPLIDAVALIAADPAAWDVDVTGTSLTAARALKAACGWARSGWTAEERAAWIAAGVTWEGFALDWLLADASPQDVREAESSSAFVFATEAGLPLTPWARQSLTTATGPMFARTGFEQDQSPEAVEALATAFQPVTNWREGGRMVRNRRTYTCGWARETDEQATAFAQRLTWRDWAVVASDLTLCLSAGMSRDEAVEYIATGGDMAPVRVMTGIRA